MLLSAGDGRRRLASEVDPLQAVAHLALIVPAMVGVVQAELAGIVFPEARNRSVVKEHAPADKKKRIQTRTDCRSFRLGIA